LSEGLGDYCCYHHHHHHHHHHHYYYYYYYYYYYLQQICGWSLSPYQGSRPQHPTDTYQNPTEGGGRREEEEGRGGGEKRGTINTLVSIV